MKGPTPEPHLKNYTHLLVTLGGLENPPSSSYVGSESVLWKYSKDCRVHQTHSLRINTLIIYTHNCHTHCFSLYYTIPSKQAFLQIVLAVIHCVPDCIHSYQHCQSPSILFSCRLMVTTCFIIRHSSSFLVAGSW